jgi:hypothetical protein
MVTTGILPSRDTCTSLYIVGEGRKQDAEASPASVTAGILPSRDTCTSLYIVAARRRSYSRKGVRAEWHSGLSGFVFTGFRHSQFPVISNVPANADTPPAAGGSARYFPRADPSVLFPQPR